MERLSIIKFATGIQLITSFFLFATAILIVFHSSYFSATNALLTVILIAYLLQILLIPFLILKIVKLEKSIRKKNDNEGTIDFCTMLISSYCEDFKEKALKDIEDRKFAHSYNELILNNNYSEILPKQNTFNYKISHQSDSILKICFLQKKLLAPDLVWSGIDKILLKVLNQNKDIAVRHLVVFQLNAKHKFFSLDEVCLANAVQPIIKGFLEESTDPAILDIKTVQQKKLRIIMESSNDLFSKEKFLPILDKPFWQIPRTIFERGMGLSLLKGYLKVNKGRLEFEKRESRLTLLFDIPGHVSV